MTLGQGQEMTLNTHVIIQSRVHVPSKTQLSASTNFQVTGCTFPKEKPKLPNLTLS